MKKFYVSFPWDCRRIVSDIPIDGNTVVLIEADTYSEARAKAFAALGTNWSFIYDDDLPACMKDCRVINIKELEAK